jgi:hypothetical protein
MIVYAGSSSVEETLLLLHWKMVGSTLGFDPFCALLLVYGNGSWRHSISSTLSVWFQWATALLVYRHAIIQTG